MGTVRPASPSTPTLLPIVGVCQHPPSGRTTSDRDFAIITESGRFPKYEVENLPWRSSLRVRLTLMCRKTAGGDLFVCPYGLSGSNSFKEDCGILYQDLKKDRIIEFSNLKIVCKNSNNCKSELNSRCDLLGKTVDKSLKVPHIFAIQVDILDGENLINSNPLFTDDIFDPGTYSFGQVEKISPEGFLNPDGGEKLILDLVNTKSAVKKGVIYGCFRDPNSDWFENVKVQSEDKSSNTIKVKVPKISMDEGDLEKTIHFETQSELGATSNTIKLLFWRKQSHIGTSTEPAVHGSSSEVENNYSSPSGNALPNDPRLDHVPSDWLKPSIRPETIDIDDQPMEDSVKMATMQPPLEVLEGNEEPDDFQPRVQNVSPKPNMADGSQAKLPFPSKVTLGGPSDTLGHNRELGVHDRVSPVPSTSTDSAWSIESSLVDGKVSRDPRLTSPWSNSQEEGANEHQGFSNNSIDWLQIEDELGERVMKRAHPISEDDPDIAPPKKPYDRAEAYSRKWSTATPNAISLEDEFEKQLVPSFDPNGILLCSDDLTES
ncbi:uncharacterized protein [Watersipora subatra]|uniref:uncharacterized protein isoform X2 n=1 Tax=Watersipora subatra TaxID=2589382 RepID=UPI00355C38AE